MNFMLYGLVTYPSFQGTPGKQTNPIYRYYQIE
jgi:hypothetical protein